MVPDGKSVAWVLSWWKMIVGATKKREEQATDGKEGALIARGWGNKDQQRREKGRDCQRMGRDRNGEVFTLAQSDVGKVSASIGQESWRRGWTMTR